MIQWLQASRRRQVHVALVALFAALHVYFQMFYAGWWIEDAAITFTYSRNLVDGEGLVPFVGAERVEGYSNPLWTFLVAAFYVVGIDGFLSSKFLGYTLGAGTVVLTWLIAREVRDGADDDATLLAPAVLAGTQTFVMYNAGGLENSLYGFLLALGIWRVVVEARRPQWPWSSLVFFGMAITRPEGIIYAALGGFWAMVTTLHAGQGVMPTLKWLATFWLPFSAYHVWRYNYFAWEWPNTYYAKQVERDFDYMRWNSRPWTYTRNGFDELRYGYYTPFYLIGLTGLHLKQWWRTVALVTAGALMFFALAYPGTDLLKQLGYPKVSVPSWHEQAAIYIICAVGLLLPLAALGKRGWRALVLCWGMAALGIFFSVYTGGDWMKGYRWLHIFTVPAAVLMGEGIGVLADLLDQAIHRASEVRWKGAGWLLAIPGMLLVPWTHVDIAQQWGNKPITGPYKIKRRVDWEIDLIHRLHMYRPTLLDVDMGAHMYWGVMPIYDYAGLIDIPLGHHQDFSKEFMKEYVFEEHKPTVAHCHGGWARKSKIPTHVEFQREYVELPGYPASEGSRTLHMGNFIRVDTFSLPEWDRSTGRRVQWGNGVRMEGWAAPVADVGAGDNLYLEVGLDIDEDFASNKLPFGAEYDEPEPTLALTDDELAELDEDERANVLRDFEREHRKWQRERDKQLEEYDLRAFRLVAALVGTDGKVAASWELPPLYDFFPVEEWSREELFWGRYDLPVPADLPEGDYDLSFVMFDLDGSVVPAEPDSAQAWQVGGLDGQPAAFALGEARFTEAVQVISADEHQARVAKHQEQITKLVEELACDEAFDSYMLLRARQAGHFDWLDAEDERVTAQIAGCWIDKAATFEEAIPKARALGKARWFDHRHPRLADAREPVIDTLWTIAEQAHASEDWETSYELWEMILDMDMQRPWARRYAEEARDKRLGLDPFSLNKKAAERLEKREAAERARQMKREAGQD